MTLFFTRLTALLLLCFLNLIPVHADAYDVGEIAIVEDTTGLMLPAEGMCDNMLFAQGLCVNHAAQAFYATHGDNYDVLMMFTPKPMNFLFNVQMGFPIQVISTGIGADDPSLFNPSQLGSAGRLRQCVKMGSMPGLPRNPYDLCNLPRITAIELMAHEIGHQWMSWVLLDMDDGRGEIPILRGWESGSANGHWSCWFNNHGSVMYGGNLVDNGDGSFTDIGGARHYSQFDQYLMGLRTADEVDPHWYIDVDGTTQGCPAMPMGPTATSNYEGMRVDFTIDDIIRANGPRIPELEPCHLKFAFILVHEAGMPPTPDEIQMVDDYRRALEDWWPWGTDNRGSIDTTIGGCGTGTAECPGEPSPQCGVVDGDITDGDTCNTGDTRCLDESSLEICTRQGRWEFLRDCEASEICVDGECVSDIPTDGDVSDGDTEDGDVTDGDTTDGDVTDGDASDGDRTDGDWSDGDSTDGDTTNPDGGLPSGGGDFQGNPPTQDDGSGGGCVSTRGTSALLLFGLIGLMILRRRIRETE